MDSKIIFFCLVFNLKLSFSSHFVSAKYVIFRPLQSQQPIYCQTSPALNPPYCTIQPLRPTMNEITSPPIITSLPTPATIFQQQHQFFAIPYLPRNNHLTSSPRDDSYVVPLRIEDVPPASSSSSISVTSEDSGVNGTLDSSNDADASGI